MIQKEKKYFYNLRLSKTFNKTYLGAVKIIIALSAEIGYYKTPNFIFLPKIYKQNNKRYIL